MSVRTNKMNKRKINHSDPFFVPKKKKRKTSSITSNDNDINSENDSEYNDNDIIISPKKKSRKVRGKKKSKNKININNSINNDINNDINNENDNSVYNLIDIEHFLVEMKSVMGDKKFELYLKNLTLYLESKRGKWEWDYLFFNDIGCEYTILHNQLMSAFKWNATIISNKSLYNGKLNIYINNIYIIKIIYCVVYIII